MKQNGKKQLFFGVVCVVAFMIWTYLVQTVDVKPIGQNGTDVGFASINRLFHEVTGVHMAIYNITDWLGLMPFLTCMLFGVLGFVQLVKRKSIFKVDYDILLLGGYYVIVIAGYLVFEVIPINYRPILIEGIMEVSYPSSTTLLVLSVMPTLIFQANRRLKNVMMKKIIQIVTILFSAFMVIGRMISGVHWLTDIVGSVLLSAGLFCIYKGIVLLCEKK